jgi:hypothetical protein
LGERLGGGSSSQFAPYERLLPDDCALSRHPRNDEGWLDDDALDAGAPQWGHLPERGRSWPQLLHCMTYPYVIRKGRTA